METQQMEHTCIVCEQRKKEGIFIVSEFICTDCETEMVHTDAQDAKYPFFIHQLKQIWLHQNNV
ncbi:sigma factor G inhibitor Gin [Paenibacillus urinalis]|uniref:Sigma factor G inhibitor Gin n=1 Tax=Paenibacillus urinalis TaxID=521520 RepID=A0AAX3MZH4_9BACL|nr:MULTISPECIES: sigma factor G inhibitor Gin [Paenibacillus]MCM3786469.1 sigma factor G inhibitor Gin [Neobacillus mesonae]OMC63257.1 inhibitor of sigma-G Gin [Paenibacillus sp. FSL H7-0326]WDH82722.1 sigma factor G inhibitor Gin [Paenibacillus urinalis]WDH98772.1 sigma factor G inhibitor Gin [Paenibacillus urinalis]WDI02466.1 sigma factor G inhibitor Gin [Paenibacillus urinalis]